jgi:GNAT superfamily N-acetyltransferase
MEIRFFKDSDIESVADALLDMSRHYNGENASSRAAILRNLTDNILGPDSGVRIVVAAEEHRVVGLAMISILYPAPKERGQLFMKELYVVSDARSAGMGRAMMKWIGRYAVSRNCVRFDWTVDLSNPRAVEFYRSLGAEPVTDKLYFRLSGDTLAAFAE